MVVCGCGVHNVLSDHHGLRFEDDGKHCEYRL